MELLVVGDVHELWDDVDAAFVEAGAQDAVLFVGDLADEDLDFVRRLAALSCRKFVVLGNHDAWRASHGGPLDDVRAMSDALGSADLGYGAADLGGLRLVGGRPFSWGGPWKSFSALYHELYGMTREEHSTERIVAAAGGDDSPIVLVAHNGPAGLGAGREAIYGRDFRKPFVDWGDTDLRAALDALRAAGRPVPLCVAGHMHDGLRGGGARRRVAREGATLHLNAAVVPRHELHDGGLRRHFLRVVLAGGAVTVAEDVWVDDGARIVGRQSLW